jgi:hypothetical protein
LGFVELEKNDLSFFFSQKLNPTVFIKYFFAIFTIGIMRNQGRSPNGERTTPAERNASILLHILQTISICQKRIKGRKTNIPLIYG